MSDTRTVPPVRRMRWINPPAASVSSSGCGAITTARVAGGTTRGDGPRLHAERPSHYVITRRDWILAQMCDLGGAGYLRALESEHGAR